MASSTATLSPEQEASLGRVAIPTQGAVRLAGPSWETARLVQDLLQENHVKYDWQFTPDGLHNHLSHAILASYSLGASKELLQDTYDLHSMAQKAMCPLQPVKISFQNWTRWLGKDEFYSTYLQFFTQEIQKYGAVATLERYLFQLRDGKLLMRTVSGALHPLIQIGHGIEFGLDALVAEGLAQACVHSVAVEHLFPLGWPNDASTASSASPLASAFSHFKALRSPLNSPSSPVGMFTAAPSRDSFTYTMQRLDPSRPRHPRIGLSGFTIVSHMLRDPRLAAGQANTPDDFPKLKAALQNRGDVIRAWCEEWVVDPQGGWTEIVEKCEELFWIATVLVSSASRPGYKGPPRMDFFLMHTLTSAIFLPGMLEMLSPTSRIQLLNAHFRVMLGYWISRGRPYPHIQEMLMAATESPEPPSAAGWGQGAVQKAIQRGGTEEVTIHNKSMKKEEEKQQEKEAEKDQDATESAAANPDGHVEVSLDDDVQEQDDKNESPKPASSNAEETKRQRSSYAVWSDVITAAVDHSDEHTTKMIRSLVFASQNFGMTPPGVWRCSLVGSELLDGTIFIRAAGLLLQSLGWDHEGEKVGSWDRDVIGFDSSWENAEKDPEYQPAQETERNSLFGNGNSRQEYPKRLDKGKGRAVEGDTGDVA